MKKSMVDVAFDLMTRKKKPVVFLKLWQEVSEIMGFTPAQEEENIAQFYGDLSLDDRFVNVLENKWDPRPRHTYNDSVVDAARSLSMRTAMTGSMRTMRITLRRNKTSEGPGSRSFLHGENFVRNLGRGT